MTKEELSLLVRKSINQLEYVSGIPDGKVPFYTGDGVMKLMDISNLNNISKSAKPIAPTDATPTQEGLYKPTQVGTYTNAGGLIAQEGYDTLFFFNGTTWTKSESKFPQAPANLRLWSALPFSKDEQVVKDNVIYIALQNVLATDVPGVSDKWKSLGSIISPQFDPTTETESQGGKQISNYLDGISIQNDPLNIGITEATHSGLYQPSNGYYILNNPFPETKIIEKISFYYNGSGTINLVIGTIEQAGRFVERKVFSKNASYTFNIFEVNEILEAGEVFGIKTPGIIPNYNLNVPSPNIVMGTESGYASILETWVYWTPAIQIQVKTVNISDDFYVKNSQLNIVKSDLENLKNSANTIISPNGSKFKIKVNNNGDLATEKIGNYKNILHFGNSILRHPITSYWWGDWGMASSTRDNDYNHKLLSMLQVSEPSAVTEALNIAPWELNTSTYDKTNFDSILALKPYDLFVLRLGENGTYTSNFKNDYRNLVLYIKTKIPNTRIVIGGQFWENYQKETAMQEVAQELGLTFVSMQGLDITSNKSFIGDVVQGDDGNSHVVDHLGVANHPNDLGMLKIAERLFLGINS